VASRGLAIQINKLATNVDRILPKIALKWKDELVVNQNPEIHMTLKSPPVLTNITNSKIQINTLNEESAVLVHLIDKRDNESLITRIFYGN